MEINVKSIHGQEYATTMEKYKADPTSFVKIDHPVYGVCIFKIDSNIREELDCEDCLHEIVSAFHPSPPRAAYPKSRKPKKGSLKPSKPLTDEERDQLFGNKSVSAQEKATTTKKTKKTLKKKKIKAPNATRKTKKPARL